MLEGIFGLKKPILGLDIGYSTLKVVQLKKSRRGIQVWGYNEVAIPPGSLQKNGIKEPRKITEAIRIALKEARPNPISGRQVVSALPESLVFTKILELPKINPREIQQAIPHELAEFCPLSPEEVYFDWQILETKISDHQMDVLVVAAPRVLVDQYIKLMKETGLEIIALETKPLASCQALVKPEEKQGLTIVDIGAETSGVSIIDQGNLRLTGTSNIGGNTITKGLAQALGLSSEQAENLKRKEGLKIGKIKNKKREILISILDPLIEEITNSIKYYQNRIAEKGQIKEIRLCGGGSQMPGLIKYIQEQTKIKTVFGDPLANLDKKESKIILPGEKLKYTLAIGLALREL